ncbi:MAG TPA: lysophospholipid acyltransferase family protein [Anaerolineaceae bacterium]|nr:lysophospholipid acyltransferase family protein [Anaerolineaceae bacterium]
MNLLQTLLNSRLGVGLALGLGRSIPPSVGYRLADWIARIIASQHRSRIVQAVQANQWVVSGGQVSRGQLDTLTLNTFRHTGRCLYDLYHNESNPAAMRAIVHLSREFFEAIENAKREQRGLLMVCPHLSNFDLVGRVIALSGTDVQVLSYPQPAGGYRWQNEMRRRYGVNMTPMSLAAMRQATECLKNQGVVLTGVDRPWPDSNYQPMFFGRPAALPASHIRLALKTGVQILVVASHMLPDGSYNILAAPPIEMQRHADLQTEIVQNQEAVLRVIEAWIRQTPEQWAMFYPVWPEALSEIPK